VRPGRAEVATDDPGVACLDDDTAAAGGDQPGGGPDTGAHAALESGRRYVSFLPQGADAGFAGLPEHARRMLEQTRTSGVAHATELGLEVVLLHSGRPSILRVRGEMPLGRENSRRSRCKRLNRSAHFDCRLCARSLGGASTQPIAGIGVWTTPVFYLDVQNSSPGRPKFPSKLNCPRHDLRGPRGTRSWGCDDTDENQLITEHSVQRGEERASHGVSGQGGLTATSLWHAHPTTELAGRR
jgi:hypothetical protein